MDIRQAGIAIMGKSTGGSGRKASNLYQRDSGIFYARVKVGKREHRRSLQTSSRAVAERRLKKWLKEISPYHGDDRRTYKEAVAEWLEACSPAWKPKTARRYDQSITVMEPFFGDLFWDQVTKAALQDFIKRRRESGVKVATINRDLSVLSGIAKHVSELDGWPEGNPVSLLPKKPLQEKRPPYIRPPASDIEAIFARMRGTFGDLCRVTLLRFFRMDEIRLLQWQDVTPDGARLYDQKNRLPAVVPWDAESWAIIDRQKRLPGSPYVFNTRTGDAYKRVTEMWREVVLRAQEAAQKDGRRFTRMRFHDLRHEGAIRYLEKGGSIYALQKLLRHSTVAQTEWYLNYLTPDQAERAKIGGAQ